MKIYHNPRCSKSRETLKIIQNKGLKVEVIEYLKTPPSKEALKDILMRLNRPVEEIIRKGEKLFKEKYKGLQLSQEEWIQELVNNPVLIERPIVINGNKAIIGRPPENINKIL